MLSASVMSTVRDFMPGLAAVVSSSLLLTAPGDDDLVAQGVKGFGKPRPMPEPPPVMRIVLFRRFHIAIFS